PDYRLPAVLSQDYWLYGRWLRHAAADDGAIVLVGDSVVWGEYVLPDGTLSHFLTAESNGGSRFVNGGVDGFFPLALEGLLRHYGGALRNRKTILHCNLLWLTSPRADLSSEREERFNHPTLIPQWRPRVPSYHATANERLAASITHRVPFMGWVKHLQDAYYGQQSIPEWTLQDDGGDPPRYPNAWRNPLSPLAGGMPSFADDPAERGPTSPRHRPWLQNDATPAAFEWVSLERSLQWGALRRVIALLQSRGNQVLVVVGPLNEHMVAPESQAAYREIREGVAAWMQQHQIPCVVPAALPSGLYADASHPLTEGYALLARRLLASPLFARFVGERSPAPDG
ncbi:MAG: hypothetical protein QHJ73_01535, partial [Armatimonadota bacterium]|nr:hypothetical protein [Armatimonadota bacterium]